MSSLLALLILLPPMLYAAVLFIFWIGLYKTDHSRSSDCPKVSIVVAARNEEANLPALLNDLMNQTYESNQIEILIADDHSEDRTAEIVKSYILKDKRIQLIQVTSVQPGLTAKKNALTQALQHATGEIILSTDADCRVLPTWTETMVSYFTSEVGMVVGFSQFWSSEKHSSFQKFQTLDFLMLMAAALGSSNLGKAWAASGQNLAYRKTVWDQVGGFTKIGHRVSGDDVLFLQLIRKTTSWKVRFASSEKAYNRTFAEPSVSAFLNQRKRWASNASYQWKLNKPFFGYVMTTFLTNLILVGSIPACVLFPEWIPLFLIGWLLKFNIELCLFLKGSEIFHRCDLTPVFPVWFFIQIPYVILVGLLGSLGGFSWKNRKHSVLEQL